MKQISIFSAILVLLLMAAPTDLVGREQPRPVRALVLLGEWFGDAYFPLQKEMESRGWTQKRVGVDAEYRGCYNKKRDVLLTSDILIPDLKDLSAWDVLIIPSGPQFRKFKEDPIVLEFLKKAHADGMLIASFCVGNFLVRASGLTDLEPPALFPDKVTLVREGLLLGPRGGGPPPGDGFESAPVKELCDAIEREFAASQASAEYAAVKHAIEQSIGWAIEKDFEAMFRLWADDLFHFWLFSDSQVVGLENFKKYADSWGDPDFRGTRFEFRDLRIVFSRSGDVAWYSCFLDDCGSFKGKESCLKNVFQTGVLEKRDGRWLHVLMHGSYPIDKVPENYVRKLYSSLFEKKNGE